MPRVTHHYWYCGSCKSQNPASRRVCQCGHRLHERHAQVHSSERSVVYYNPATGEHRTPPRNDMVMPEVYARDGFERREIMSMTAWEKEAGVVHEATTFAPGAEPSPERYETPTIPKEAKEALVKDMAAAISSGPWTGQEALTSLLPSSGQE